MMSERPSIDESHDEFRMIGSCRINDKAIVPIYLHKDSAILDLDGDECTLIKNDLHEEIIEFIEDIMDDCKSLESYAIQVSHKANRGLDEDYKRGESLLKKLRGES
jgi:hypothetical protein